MREATAYAGSVRSELSNIESFVIDTGQPTLLSAQFDPLSGATELLWSDEGAATYRLYWSTTAGVTAQNPVFAVSGTGFEHEHVLPGQPYFYRVSAVTGNGEESPLSNELSVTPIAGQLTAPHLNMPRCDHSLELFWSPVAGATGYRLYYCPYPFTGIETLASIDLGAQTSLSSLVEEGDAFYLVLAAYDANGSSPLSNVELCIAAPESAAPDVPWITSAEYNASGNSVVVFWNDVGADHYKLFWSDSAGVSTSSEMLTSTTLRMHVHGDVLPGTTNYYRVLAVNSEGVWSDLSSEVSVIVPQTSPENPTNPPVVVPLPGPTGGP